MLLPLKHNVHKIPDFFVHLYDKSFIKWITLEKTKIQATTSKKMFFIVGSGRSGNTLLRSVLAAHSKICIPPESYVLPLLYRKYIANKDMNWNDLSGYILQLFDKHPQFEAWELTLQPLYDRVANFHPSEQTLGNLIISIYEFYAEVKNPNKFIIGDKTPINTLYLSWVLKIFPNSKIIHIIRDGRDVVSSYLKAGLYTKVDDACARWNDSINTIFKLSEGIQEDNLYEIKYEKLVKEPDKHIQKVCTFLNVSYEDSMLARNNSLKKLGDVHRLTHHNNVLNPINSSSIGKWKLELTEAEQTIVIKKLRKNLKRLQYA